MPLPPYGPELNLVERLFLEFRRELANQLFDSIDAIQSAATQDFEAVAKLASVTELLIGEGQQTPVSIAFFTYSCA